jgi:hypothetical protein
METKAATNWTLVAIDPAVWNDEPVTPKLDAAPGSQEHFHHNLIVMLAIDLYLPR